MKKKKTALITGGTSGVGLSIARALVKNNYEVFIIGRNQEKGKAITLDLNKHGACAEFICLDLECLSDVALFAEDFANKQERLDLLVNAAGIVLPKREITKEGLEKTFATGYLSAFILSNNLAKLLKRTEGARIVNVSAQPKSVLIDKLDFENLDFSKNYNGFKASLTTVNAKTVLTQLLAEKFVPLGIDVNCFHPGIVRSQLTRSLPFGMRFLMKLFSPFMSRISENGIFVSESTQLNGITGQLYVNKKSISLNFDTAYKEELWLKSIELLKKLKIDIDENS